MPKVQPKPKPKTAKEKLEEKEAKRKKIKQPRLLRGFRDILPEEQFAWDMIEDVARTLSDDYSFGRIRLPYLEKRSLFERTVGKGTDIIEKELFAFEDQGGDKVSMRPEATAQIARAYIEHGMINKPQPVKMWYFGPMFRYDRPQAGRYRQFWQWGLEAVGSDDPIMDAQLIMVCHKFFKELGLEVTFQINSLGSADSRREYIMELVSYFKQFRRKLSDVDKKRLAKNPLRLLDSKEEGMAELKVDAPQILDWIDDKSKEHFMKVLEYLDEAEVPYELNPFLVRGLDYYNRTVFEIIQTGVEEKKEEDEETALEETIEGEEKTEETEETEEGEEKVEEKEEPVLALGGGGRYDELIPQLGGRDENSGAMGVAIGIERVILALKKAGIEIPKQRPVDVFFCQLGEAARRKGLRMFEDLRIAGIATAEAFGKGSLKAQLELADKMGVKLALILGQKEVLDGTIIIRNMESGGQEIVDAEKLVELVKKQIKK